MKQLKISKQITNRESESLDKYLQDIGKLELISGDEEAELARRIREGDESALDALVKANLRFVVSVAKQYQNRNLSLPDLINEGNVGLVKAASRFDETRGFKFISYAVWWIRQSIIQALAEQSRVVRLPLNRINSIGHISRKTSELEQRYERDPTPSEIADELDIKAEDVRLDISVSGRHISFDAPFAGNEFSNLLDVYVNKDDDTPDSELMLRSLQQEIQRMLTTLTPREAHIIELSFGLNGISAMTLEEIGQRMEITRERVRQIREQALRKMKLKPRSQNLKEYL